MKDEDFLKKYGCNPEDAIETGSFSDGVTAVMVFLGVLLGMSIAAKSMLLVILFGGLLIGIAVMFLETQMIYPISMEDLDEETRALLSSKLNDEEDED